MSDDLRFSRLNASAHALAGADFKPERFVKQPVLLTGSREVLATENGREIARCALLLLMRMTKSLTVAIPHGLDGVARDLSTVAMEHAWDETPQFVRGPVDHGRFVAVLSVGGLARADMPLTVITSNGWSVRVSSSGAPISQTCDIFNPVGALAAASAGAGEIFKRLLGLRQDAGRLLNGEVFSLWSYDDNDGSGPALPPRLTVDVLVAGGGAIGNGVAHLLSTLPVSGRCRVIDKQAYGPENWGTCLRLTRKGVGRAKAKVLDELLAPVLDTKSDQSPIEEAEARADWRLPSVVLSGFDNVEARHAVQDLWPDLVIDGAIGPKLECQVSTHPWNSAQACLRCAFELPAGEKAEVVQQRKTGLSASILSDLTRELNADDIAVAAPEKQAWLKEQVGKPICSVLEAAQALSDKEVDAGFRPSVPFVATMSACMMVTELVRYAMEGAANLQPRFFFSLLWGARLGESYPEDRHTDCTCVTRARNIERVRAGRSVA